MNITLLAMFMSTFTLIEADIDVTRRGMVYYDESNPIAATFTSRNAWNDLTITAYAANTAAFFALGALGKMAHGDELGTAWQVLYIVAISAAEIYALSQWSSEAHIPVYVKVQPLYVMW